MINELQRYSIFSHGQDCYVGMDQLWDGDYVRYDDVKDMLKDAIRYRWLRMQHWKDNTLVVIFPELEDIYDLSQELLDATIDKEMEKSNLGDSNENT